MDRANPSAEALRQEGGEKRSAPAKHRVGAGRWWGLVIGRSLEVKISTRPCVDIE